MGKQEKIHCLLLDTDDVIKVKIKNATPSGIFHEDLPFLHSLFSLSEVRENSSSQKC